MGKKKYEFSVSLTVKELSQVPYANGVLFAKLRVLDGRNLVRFSPKESVAKNRVVWNWGVDFEARLSSDEETGVLAPSLCRISVRREVLAWKVTAKKMGFLDVDLAEHARGGLVSIKRILEGYDSKNMDNSILYVTIDMKLKKGDPCYKVPNISRVDDSFEEWEVQGRGDLSSWYQDIGSIRFHAAYDSNSPATPPDSLPEADASTDALVADTGDADDSLPVEDDDDDDSAFVTANDASLAAPLDSTRRRRMSFSSPDVARVGIEEIVSPIVKDHAHLRVGTPPTRPRLRDDETRSLQKRRSGDGGAASIHSGVFASSSSVQKVFHLRQPSSGAAADAATPPFASIASSSVAGGSTGAIERDSSWKRGHRRDLSSGTKNTMLWLKASEEYAEERRRRADLPPCVSADEVVADILEEFDARKNCGDEDDADSSGLKLSDVQ